MEWMSNEITMTEVFPTIFGCPESKVLELALTEGEKTFTLTDISKSTKLTYPTVKRVVEKFVALKFLVVERIVGNTTLYRFDLPLIGDFIKEGHSLMIKVR